MLSGRPKMNVLKMWERTLDGLKINWKQIVGTIEEWKRIVELAKSQWTNYRMNERFDHLSRPTQVFSSD